MKPILPHMIWSTVNHGAKHYILALVRLFNDDAGQAILESSDGELIAVGQWSINFTHDDEDGATPTTVDVEFPDTYSVSDSLLNALLDQLVQRGGTWGLDAYSPHGDT